MKKLLIIDGSALLFQSFYGMPRKIVNNKGQNVEAVICFVGILFKTIAMHSADELLIVFDGENDLARKEIDDQYKSNRQDYSCVEDQDNPFLQLETIKLVLDHLGFKWQETIGCEGDDFIASIVNDNKKQCNIVISSPDKDFYQLICDTVSVFTYRGKVSTLIDKRAVYDKYGFDPVYFDTFKALVGDNSDNIKGIRGIGPKTASTLIKDFGGLENILKNAHKLKSSLRDLIVGNKQKLLQNLQIISLKDKTGLCERSDWGYAFPKESSTNILKKMGIL